MVLEERGTPAGLRQAPQEMRREGGRAAPGRGGNSCRWQPHTSSIYRGRGGAAPPSRVPSLGVAAAPKTHLGCGQGGEERGRPRVGLKAHLDLGFAPSHSPMHLGPWWGAHQPTWGWSPPTLGPCSPPGLVDPLGGPLGPSRWSRYVTDKPRNFSGDQSRTSHI